MKKRTKKSLKEKDFLRLKRELEKKWEAQRNLGWVELDEPIHDGFIAELTLRSDVANREDAWVFQEIINNFGTTSYAKKINDFQFVENYHVLRVKNKSNPFVIYHKPHIREIDEARYNALLPQVRKYFSKSVFSSSWKGNLYYCNIPTFYFDIKIEKRWINRVKIFDEILQQEESEIENEISRKYYNNYYNYNSVPKNFRKGLNKKQKAKAKRVLHQIVNNLDENFDYLFEDNYKNAAWLYW